MISSSTAPSSTRRTAPFFTSRCNPGGQTDNSSLFELPQLRNNSSSVLKSNELFLISPNLYLGPGRSARIGIGESNFFETFLIFEIIFLFYLNRIGIS